MSFVDDLRQSRAPAAGLVAIGLFWGAFAGWLPDIKMRAGVSDAQFGALMMLSAVGGMTAMSIAPRLRKHFGHGLLPASGLAVAVVALFPALIGSRWELGLVLLVLGMTMSLCDILANIRISEIEARVGHSLMNLNHALFSFALALSAGMVGVARQLGISHGVTVIIVSLAIFALVPLMRRRRPRTADPDNDASKSSMPAPWLIVLPGAAILWLCFLAENGTESWAAIHIERTLEAEGGLGAFGPAMFALSMGCARLAGQWLAVVLGEVRLIAVSVIFATIGALLLAFAPGLGLALMGAAALGLGVAVVVPTANSLIGRTVPDTQRASAIARAWMIGFTGFFIGPPVMGLVSETMGLRVAFGLIALLVAAILPCLWLLARRLRPAGA
ncbi:MFS transporter [Paracoccus sp. M683]|uniref:MFS transporter n=1 Tax=Paracoccus sp. M683 TaxID=2594268 RepID=UPI0011812448|nr:MFS transporter [Paracoccus sp. M683]TRW96256.1 MFS transporter [Paracoccus sp. M683]